MNGVRIPVPRPVSAEESASPARGGVDDEELRRVERNAERFVQDQASVIGDALRAKQQQEQSLVIRQAEAQEARAILARAETVKAEANTRLAIWLAVATIGALVLGPLILNPLRGWRSPG